MLETQDLGQKCHNRQLALKFILDVFFFFSPPLSLYSIAKESKTFSCMEVLTSAYHHLVLSSLLWIYASES